MKRIFTSLILLCITGHLFAQTFNNSASTAGAKYPLLEAAVATWAGHSPDVQQDVYEKIKPLYPRTIIALWHSSALTSDPMTLPGDPYAIGTGYIPGFPGGTVDRDTFAGVVGLSLPFDTFVAQKYTATPNYDVAVNTSYDVATRLLTVQVTGTSLATLTGDWNINAYVVEDSISTGAGALYHQVNDFSGTSLLSSTGSASWYTSAPSPISSGAVYSHMNVVRAILAPGHDIWGEAAFSNPASGTSVTKIYTYILPVGSVPNNMRVIGLVQHYDLTGVDRSIANAVEVNMLPSLYFSRGRTQTVNLCSGSSLALDSMLSVYDSSTGHILAWAITGATHGSLSSTTYGALSTGGTMVPAGLTYLPATGYSGADTLQVVITDGSMTDTTMINVTVNPMPVPITGTVVLCAGDTVALLDSPAGGMWTSSTTSVATVDTVGNVIARSAGTSAIRYTLPGGCFSTVTVTVNSYTAGTITGANTICTGGNVTLTSSVPGGQWNSASTFIASVDTLSGVVTGVTSGITTISYILTTTCGAVYATMQVTVSSVPNPGVITGPSSLCVGRHIVLSDIVGPGTWSAVNTRAIVSPTGVVVGAIGGLDTVVYTAVLSCGVASTGKVITIVPLPDTGVIVGLDTICVGLTVPYTNVAGGGVWSSSNGRVTFVSGGIVTGTAIGVDTIRYTASDSCGTLTAKHPIYVGAVGACAVHAGSVANSPHDIELYPDPARTALTISAAERISSVVVTDLAGHRLLNVSNNTEKAIIDVSALPDGVYLVRINGSVTKKFVKQ